MDEFNLILSIADRSNFEQYARSMIEEAKSQAVTNLDESIELFDQLITGDALVVDDYDFALEIWVKEADKIFNNERLI